MMPPPSHYLGEVFLKKGEFLTLSLHRHRSEKNIQQREREKKRFGIFSPSSSNVGHPSWRKEKRREGLTFFSPPLTFRRRHQRSPFWRKKKDLQSTSALKSHTAAEKREEGEDGGRGGSACSSLRDMNLFRRIYEREALEIPFLLHPTSQRLEKKGESCNCSYVYFPYPCLKKGIGKKTFIVLL